ncbi:MAG TPA: protein kinase [Blastocatellia bacterium]|nr:protein kinase [Blastocatellia bacterium]
MTRCTRCSGDLLDLAVFCPKCGQPREPEFERLLNCSLSGRYQIRERLGEGGLSTVFVALDTHTDQTVVVKVSDPRQLVRNLPGEAFDQTALRNYWAEMLQRMRREVVALVNVQHPNIVRIFDTDLITDELRYIVMERLHGHTLREELSLRGRLSVREAIRLTEAVTAGLSAVHARGIVHRDLNPRNLFLCGTGTENPRSDETDELLSFALSGSECPAPDLKIIDFGIARIPQPPGTPPFTQYAVLSGTVSYAAPEQCQNLPLDQRSDIYSLGVVLYEMVTGQRPFTGLTPTEIAVRQIRDEPVSPRALVHDLPAGVETTILRALAKDPQKRQQSVEELAAELSHYRDGVSARVVVPLNTETESLASILSGLPEAPAIPQSETGESEPLSTESATASDLVPATQADIAFDQLQRTDSRRRRRVLALAAMLLLLAAAGALSGTQLWSALEPYFSSAHQQAEMADLTTPSPLAQASPFASPGEMQASSTGNSSGNSAAPPESSQRSAAASSPQSGAAYRPFSTDSFGEKLLRLASGIIPSATVTPKPSPAAPSVSPQMPPAPAPTISITREPQPSSNPAESHGPVREPASAENAEPHWSPSGSGQSDRQPYQTTGSDHAVQDSDQPPQRSSQSWPQRDDRQADNRRMDDHRYERDDEPETPPVTDSAPKVITWSGEVNQEREIRLELPGVPGNVNIPRQYRRRVGMVEPPGPHNRWRCVVLRVFGNGRTSIVVQWWPTPRQFTQSAGNFLNRQVIGRVSQASRAVTEQFSRLRK